ncbi:MAG: ABC transporter permease subunit [Myxococcales bacterium]|nr:ABC transporter permease subunit [Myxococcales bacterium]
MLRFALRRLLWVFPSVLGVSLVAFYILSLLPAPAELVHAEPAVRAAERRERFLDLPLFLNTDPRDLRTLVERALDDLARGGQADGERGARELARLGSAALPVLLPGLDALAPEVRTRVALALEPVARRMGERGDEPGRADAVVVFWQRFWETHSIEFREGTVRSAVRRYAEHGSRTRVAEMRALDTYALPALLEALPTPEGPDELERARRIVEVLGHVTGRVDRIEEGASRASAGATVDRWRRWWMVYGGDFVALGGAARVGAMFLETRYGKWVLEAVSMRLGRDAAGVPVLDKLLERLRLTLAIMFGALALAYLWALPLGVASALWHGKVVDRLLWASALLPYALSPAVLGVVALGLGAPLGGALVWPTLLLALALVADPARQVRSALLVTLCRDHVLAARARGAGRVRILWAHGVRNALWPLATRATLELPTALTGAFVLERAFKLPGLCDATVEAVAQRDAGFLMALAVAAAAWSVLVLVATDLAYAALDPRVRSAIGPVRGRDA